MEDVKEKDWRKVKYGRRFLNAFRGLRVLFKTTRHIWLYIFFAFLLVLLGFYFRLSSLEWIALIFSVGFVFSAEAVNTAIEIDIDLTSPEFHPYARDTKDVAAAAVLLSVFTAAAAGLIIFVPKLLNLMI